MCVYRMVYIRGWLHAAAKTHIIDSYCVPAVQRVYTNLEVIGYDLTIKKKVQKKQQKKKKKNETIRYETNLNNNNNYYSCLLGCTARIDLLLGAQIQTEPRLLVNVCFPFHIKQCTQNPNRTFAYYYRVADNIICRSINSNIIIATLKRNPIVLPICIMEYMCNICYAYRSLCCSTVC